MLKFLVVLAISLARSDTIVPAIREITRIKMNKSI